MEGYGRWKDDNEIRVPSEEAVQLVEYCIQNGYKISTAESCTGGLIAAGIVDVPGASNVFEEGYVTYADRVKQKLLHVSVTTIQKYTVVSAQVAEEMALGTAHGQWSRYFCYDNRLCRTGRW